MRDAVAAEFRKLRSVRSTYVVLAVTAAFAGVTVLLAFEVAHAWDTLPAERRARFELRPVQEFGIWTAGLCLAVLGVLSATSEYRTGMIRTSLVAVPRRGVLLAAKAAVTAAVAAAAGETVSLAGFFATRLIVGDRPFPDRGGSAAHELPGLLVLGSSAAVYALLGLALGVMLRSTAGAIVTVVLAWHVVPLLVYHLPAPWNERLGSLMLAGLPAQILGRGAENSIYGDLLSPPAAALMMLTYALVPLAGAAVVITRRDA